MFDLKSVSSLEKILPDRKCDTAECKCVSGLENETVSFQLVFASDKRAAYSFDIAGDGLDVKVYFVENVPVEFPTFPLTLNDSDFISHLPGLYPDRLVPADRNWVQVTDIYKALWVSVSGKCGVHKLNAVFRDENGETAAECSLDVHIINAELPKQDLIYTQWFHTDCISEFYGFETFSEEHWAMIEKFMRLARENGINMILTPVFSPPLDTQVGRKRPVSQLLKIKKNGKSYSFDFSRVKRWINLCQAAGFEYYEMPHLFTQWGAEFTPRIIAEVDGEEKDIFGWNVYAVSEEYDNFLSQLLPQLLDFLKSEGIFAKIYFHISDEPFLEHLENYGKARRIAEKYLEGCKIIDALSDYDFYRNGVVRIPIPSTDHIKPFLDAELSERWCYYCCSQCVNVSNRFTVMPSSRNRSIGFQLYKYRMDGFLHWGFNFYYSQYSRILLDPFAQTDAYDAFPSGDAIGAYPCRSGPAPSIGLVVFNEALQDLRALKLLEKYIGYENTVSLAEKALGEEISFDSCYCAEAILKTRECINNKIASETEKRYYRENCPAIPASGRGIGKSYA